LPQASPIWPEAAAPAELAKAVIAKIAPIAAASPHTRLPVPIPARLFLVLPPVWFMLRILPLGGERDVNIKGNFLSQN
jgi:hypothetical protein